MTVFKSLEELVGGERIVGAAPIRNFGAGAGIPRLLADVGEAVMVVTVIVGLGLSQVMTVSLPELEL